MLLQGTHRELVLQLGHPGRLPPGRIVGVRRLQPAGDRAEHPVDRRPWADREDILATRKAAEAQQKGGAFATR